MNNLKVFYLSGCPIDKSDTYFEEIYKYGFCQKDFKKFKKPIWKLKESLNVDKEDLKYFKDEYLSYQELKKFKVFFKKNLGHEPLKIQLYWAKRIFKGDSFSIIAPTGIGKTTFGNLISHYLGGKVYYLVPSKILLKNLENKLKKIKSTKKVLVIKEKEDKELLKSSNFDILLTTSYFLHKNFDIIPKDFDMVFIDDADSLIRQPKNIDKILKLVKFTEEEINQALEIIDKKRKAKNKNDYDAIENLKINKKEKGIIIAASATLTPRTKRIFLFRELLGFEIGSSTTSLRNIEELYSLINKKTENITELKSVLLKKSISYIKRLGNGGLIFLNDDFNKEDLNNYLQFLKDHNIEAISYEKFNTKNQNLFLNDKIQVVVGFSNVRNPLTRGIDFPQKIRYALFVGVPKFKIPLKTSYSPFNLFLLALSLREIVENKTLIEKDIRFLKKISFLKEEQILINNSLKEKIESIKNNYESLINDKKIIKAIENHPRLTLKKEEGDFYLIVSDPRGYLQASGRTSRLFPLGLTKGLSVILVDDLKTLKHLEDKLKILGYLTEFKEFDEKNLDNILKKIDDDRKIVKKVLEGEEFIFKDPIESVLVIVESPTKAKTLANFFGKPSKRIKDKIILYEISLGKLHLNICATLGHFVDLVHQEGFYGVKLEKNNFVPIFKPLKICQNCQRHLQNDETECIICKSKDITSKEELIQNLQKIASEVDKVYLATDPDTEGEKIAFDLLFYLYPYNQNIKRIELHEITKEEFIKRIQEPKDINFNLVKAQILRRISDRWIGFRLSEEIQKKFQNLNLSAGRVQTPVLGWILEKEEKIKNKHYVININFNNQQINFISSSKRTIKLLKDKFKNDNLFIEIKFLEKDNQEIKPLPPYDTSNLLKDANLFFKFDTDTTMKIAQNLFEQGFITYHRTDSIFVSEFGRNIAYQYLEKNNMLELLNKRSWSEIGTHEAIRPTKPLDVQDLIESIILEPKNLTKKHLQLYGLIFNRFISSQMKPSKALLVKAEINLSNKISKIDSFYSNIIEENHLKFFKNIRILNLQEGKFEIERLRIKRTSKEYHFLQGELIDKMKKTGLGRPSTYSNIVQTLIERKYVLNKGGYLIPTSWGKKIYDYLINNHKNLVSENFTVKLEKDMDLVEEGKKNYQTILKQTFKKIFKSSF